jgi:hypothetical protein
MRPDMTRLGTRLAGGAILLAGLVGAAFGAGTADDLRARRGYERHDTRATHVIAVGAGMLIALAVVFVLVTWYQARLTDLTVRFAPPEGGVADVPRMDPWRLEADSGHERRTVEAGWREHLASYGWVDRERGIAHVPIEIAMQQLLEQGVPSRDDGTPFRTRMPSPSASGRFVERPTR